MARQAVDILDSVKDKLSDGEFLTMMNAMKRLHTFEELEKEAAIGGIQWPDYIEFQESITNQERVSTLCQELRVSWVTSMNLANKTKRALSEYQKLWAEHEELIESQKKAHQNMLKLQREHLKLVKDYTKLSNATQSTQSTETGIKKRGRSQ